MRKLHVCLVGMLYPLIGWSQPALEKDYYLLRGQDYLYKQQVEYINPGKAGEELIWDFSNLKMVDENYKVSHMEYPNFLFIVRELRSLYKYTLKGDSLVSTGMENTTLFVEYDLPELQLVYPVNYQDIKEDYFYGRGDYCKQIGLIVSGKSSYEADAYGTIILPEGDTLQVLRVKHTRLQLEDQYSDTTFLLSSQKNVVDSIEWRLSNDTLITQTDSYRWYAEGYRYPVFESIEYYVHHQGTSRLHASTSFYYSPYEQYYGLENDPENTHKREMLAMRKEQNKDNNTIEGEKQLIVSEQENFTYTLYQDKQKETLTVNYELSHSAEVSITLLDMQGRIVSQIDNAWRDIGNYQEQFYLDKHLKGEYLLRITSGESNYTEKIMN